MSGSDDDKFKQVPKGVVNPGERLDITVGPQEEFDIVRDGPDFRGRSVQLVVDLSANVHPFERKDADEEVQVYVATKDEAGNIHGEIMTVTQGKLNQVSSSSPESNKVYSASDFSSYGVEQLEKQIISQGAVMYLGAYKNIVERQGRDIGLSEPTFTMENVTAADMDHIKAGLTELNTHYMREIKKFEGFENREAEHKSALHEHEKIVAMLDKLDLSKDLSMYKGNLNKTMEGSNLGADRKQEIKEALEQKYEVAQEEANDPKNQIGAIPGN